MELVKISLKKNQEIQSISLNPGDNGGCSLRYSIYTPSLKNSDSVWDERNEIFGDGELDNALARITELYKANLSNRKPKSDMVTKGSAR